MHFNSREEIYLAENFRPLMERGGVSVIHPDILTVGDTMEMKKLSNMCNDYGIAVAVQNILSIEFHSVDISRLNDASGITNRLMTGSEANA